MALHWYVLRVKPHKERTVCRLLQSRELDVYYPVLKVQPKNPRAARERPYFPGYMFVQADLSDIGDNALRWVPGAHGLVSFGEVPAVVSPHLIYEIKKRLDAMETNGDIISDDLQSGDRVRIVTGLFEGYEAVFDMNLPGNQRVQVLLSFLSRGPQPVKLAKSDIEKLG